MEATKENLINSLILVGDHIKMHGLRDLIESNTLEYP